MALLFWDASALIKRYFVEVGSDTVDTLFSHGSAHEMATTPSGYAETYSILLRRHNGGVIDLPTYTAAVTSLQGEVVDDPDFGFLSIDDTTIFSSIFLMRKHNLNATDAAILTMLLYYRPALPPGLSICVLAADKRLLRAADDEGLRTLNPEALASTGVSAFLSSL